MGQDDPIAMWAVMVDDGLGRGPRPHELSLAHTAAEAVARARKAVPHSMIGDTVRVDVTIERI